MNRFVATSVLKSKAKKEVDQRISEWSSPKRVVNQFIGISATNKDWFDEARRKFKLATQTADLRKIDYLISALFDIYKCNFRMKYNRFPDSDIPKLLKRIETSYFNTVLAYIEQNIYQANYTQKVYGNLVIALQVLAEENRQLSSGYQKILDQYNNRGNFVTKLEQILELPELEFNSTFAEKIAVLWRSSDSILKKNNLFMKDIQSQIQTKLDQVFDYFWNQLQEELEKSSPRLNDSVFLVDKLLNIHNPLKLIVKCKYYNNLIEMRTSYNKYKQFLEFNYPEILKLYKYLQIPKTKEPLDKIYSTFKELKETKEIWDNKFFEFTSLEPTLALIYKFLDDKLYNLHKTEIMNFYKHYNKILSESDISLRLKEMIKYSEYLKVECDKCVGDPFLSEKLKELIESLEDDVRKIIYKYLEENLASTEHYEDKIQFYDEAIALFISMKSLADVELVQNQKNKFVQDGVSFDTRETEIIDSEDRTVKIDMNPNRLIILDNYSLKNYVIFSNPVVTIGRSIENQIILRCQWISQKHLKMDFHNNLIIDQKSTNGTRFNDKYDDKNHENLTNLESFCIANIFKFKVNHFMKSISFKLVEVLDEQYDSNPENQNYLESLKNTTFVYLANNDEFTLHKTTAKLNDHYKTPNEIIQIRRFKDKFLLSDAVKNIDSESIEQQSTFSERFTFNLS
jgi:hypothetical protein